MPTTLTMELDDHLFDDSDESPEAFVEELKFLVAAKLYELGRVSSGIAARMCGMGRVDFLLSLQRLGIPMSNIRPEDVETELRFAEKLAESVRPSGHQ